MYFKRILQEIVISGVKPDFLISSDFCCDFLWFLSKCTRSPKVSYPLKALDKLFTTHIFESIVLRGNPGPTSHENIATTVDNSLDNN